MAKGMAGNRSGACATAKGTGELPIYRAWSGKPGAPRFARRNNPWSPHRIRRPVPNHCDTLGCSSAPGVGGRSRDRAHGWMRIVRDKYPSRRERRSRSLVSSEFPSHGSHDRKNAWCACSASSPEAVVGRSLDQVAGIKPGERQPVLRSRLMSALGHSRRFGFVRFRGIADMNS
jgi:hypothetical protein